MQGRKFLHIVPTDASSVGLKSPSSYLGKVHETKEVCDEITMGIYRHTKQNRCGWWTGQVVEGMSLEVSAEKAP